MVKDDLIRSSQEVSWIYYDTQTVLARDETRVGFFQAIGDGERSNMDLAGCLPFPVSFVIQRLELTVLSPETVNAVLASFPHATVQFHVANRIYGDWPFEELTRERRVIRTYGSGEPGDSEIVEVVHGLELEHKLLLDPQIHFALYVYFNHAESPLLKNFYLRAMLFGTKIRPVV